ncbi:MAG: insulinase family protein, partial [Ginsengibacter sp.]
MPNRTIAPPIIDAIEFKIKLNPCTHSKLSNGVPLYYINDGTEEVAQIDFVFKAGNSYEKQSGIAGSTNYFLKNGTSTKIAFEISELFEYYGAFVSQSCYNETATVTLHCLSKYLKELLPVIREMFTDSIFPEEEIAIFKQNSIQRLSVNLLKCDFVANRLIDTYLYGSDHPYGKFTTEESI